MILFTEHKLGVDDVGRAHVGSAPQKTLRY